VRKRKVTYPVARTSRRPADQTRQGEAMARPSLVAIDLTALAGREGLAVGTRVRVPEGGLYGGEPAVITALTGGVIPSAIVRTDLGRERRVRTIDLEPIRGEG
jgi:hypothetical protein